MKRPTATEMAITIPVSRKVSWRLGHSTLASSKRTSLRNVTGVVMGSIVSNLI